MSSKALFHVTVKALVTYKEKILILKKVKPSKDHFGYWEFPGGGMEYDESCPQAIRREVFEETGLEIEVIAPLSTFHVKRVSKQIVGIYFLCETFSDDVKLSDEHTEYKFVDMNEIQDYMDPTLYRDVFRYLD